jgi:hypothetical protein
MQHVAAWQRLNFLTSLAYPQGYAGGIGARAPFLKFTLGNMYKDRNCYIDSLSYSIDDNTPWHVGFTEASGLADDSKFVINGEQTSLDNYILPKIIDVAITLKLVEQRSNTETEYLYGFDKLPRINLKGANGITSLYTTEQSSKNSQIAANANNNSLLLGTVASDNSKTENNKQLTTAASQATTIPASEANRITNFIAGGVNLNNSSTLGLSNNFKFAPNPLAGIPPFKTTLSPFNIDTNNILLKQTYAKMQGFKYEIWIFNYKNILEKIID